MLGLFGVLSESVVPGANPTIEGKIATYAGNLMVPFEGQFHLF